MKNAKRTLLMTGMLVAALTLAACGRGDDPTPTPAPAAVEQLPSQELATATPAPAGDAASTSSEATSSESTTETTTESTTASTTESTTESTTASTGSSSGPVASSGNASIDAVASALRNQIANLPMRMTMTSGETAGGTVEIASPTRLRMDMGGMQLIIVDGRAFMLEDGVWTENPAMAGMVTAFAGNVSPEAIQEQVDMLVTANQLPDETINGQAVSVYQFTVSDDTDTSRVYVRKADNLPVRVTNDATGEDAYSVDYDYDPSIVIEAPQ